VLNSFTTSTDLPSQIHAELDGLDPEKQRRVLDYVRNLKQNSTGMTGAQFKQFVGIFSAADAKTMMDAIEAGCEQVNLDGLPLIRW
jgi:hypothetical protein